MEEMEVEGMAWDDDRFMEPWDEGEYEVDPEREWGKFDWLDDELVPVDSILKLR